MPIPEENQDSWKNGGPSPNDSSLLMNSQMKSDSSNSYINPPYNIPSMTKGNSYQPYSSYTSDRSYVPAHLMSAGGVTGSSHGIVNQYNLIYHQDEEELLNFTRKMFVFFSMQKIILGLFILFVYNNVRFTEYVKGSFWIFVISVFIMMTVLFLVHVSLEIMRKSPQSYVCYFLFTLTECWVVAFILATTDASTAFVFTGTVTSMVLGITIFLHTNTINYLRGFLSVVLMGALIFALCVATLNYTDMVTILVCLTGGLMFGVFLLSKAFTWIQGKSSLQLTKDDYVIGSLTVYVDFGFILLLMMFVMLAMIKSFLS